MASTTISDKLIIHFGLLIFKSWKSIKLVALHGEVSYMTDNFKRTDIMLQDFIRKCFTSSKRKF